MNMSNRITEELTKIVEALPEEKAEVLIDFARFLCKEYKKKSNSLVDIDSLLVQQRSLSKIWDNPEENIYEL